MDLSEGIFKMKGELFAKAPPSLAEAAEKQCNRCMQPIEEAVNSTDTGVRAVGVMLAFAVCARLVAVLEELELPK